MGLFSEIYYFYLRKIQPGFKIDNDALVVDIGSGDKPFWRADVFVDKLSLGNVQRASKFNTIHDMGMFVDSDVARMPFRDKTFDFSFASHLLEHVKDPDKVIKEITRISKGGYIEVPNGLLETIRPFDSHLWFVYQEGKKIVFVRKGKRLHEVLTKNGFKYDSLLNTIPQPFIRLYWSKTIAYEIIDNYKENEKFKSKIGNNKNKGKKIINPYLFLVKVIRALFYRQKTLDIKLRLIK